LPKMVILKQKGIIHIKLMHLIANEKRNDMETLRALLRLLTIQDLQLMRVKTVK